MLAPRGVFSELVGREAALERLKQIVTRAIGSKVPTLVTVAGNHGTGKTRLVGEWVGRHLSGEARVYRGRALPDGGRLAAVASLLRSRFGVNEADAQADGEARARFEAEVEQVFGVANLAEVLHVLGGLVELPYPEPRFLQMLRENRVQHDEIIRTVLCRFIEADAQQSPLVLIFDNLQWADDESLLLLRQLGASLGQAPVVIVACTRPEMLVRCPEWSLGPIAHERVELRNLEPDDAELMFRNLLIRCDNVPDDVVMDAVEMTGGNPHFLEQLVRLFLANGTIDTSDPIWRLEPERATATELPISIQEAIEARIAALAVEERDVLEKGAVFGNVFWIGAVVALTRIAGRAQEGSGRLVVEQPETDSGEQGCVRYTWTRVDDPVRRRVVELIDELAERDYLLKLDPEDSTFPGDTELVFKHNLEHELVVKSTEPERKARYHRLAAQWLETKLAGRSEEQLEFLAQLYERGGDRVRAAHCYLAGGDKARARYANQEAVNLYMRGLAMIDDHDAVARFTALHNLGDVLDLVGRTEEAAAQFRAMLQLAWLYDDQAKAGAANGRIGRIYRRLGEYDLAMEHLREAHDLFARASDERGIASTLDDMGQVHWLRGAYAQAMELHRQALAIRRTIGDARSIALSLANIGRVHRDSGSFQAAIGQFREALELRRSIGDLPGVVQSLCDLGGVYTEDGSREAALELFNEAYGMAVETGDKLAQADVLARVGVCKSVMGRSLEAVQHLRAAVEISTNLGDRVTLAECLWRLAEIHLAAGDIDLAYDDARRALRISEAVGSRVHVGNAHRVLAEAVVAKGLSHETERMAEEHFDRAMEILVGMRNELELARVYRSYAVLREHTGQTAEAARLRRLADDIYARLRGAALGEGA